MCLVIFAPFLLCFALFLWMYFGFHSMAGLPYLWYALIFPAFILSLIFFGPLALIKLRKMEDPVYEFDEWKMTMITSKRTVPISWGNLTHYRELHDYFLIVHGSSDLAAHIIPKREFKSLEELDAFEKLLIGTGLKKK